MENSSGQDQENILNLIERGYAVTFEGSGVGDYFCLLRDIGTNQLVNCTIGQTISGALAATVEWAASARPGNGTGPRHAAETASLPVRVTALEGLTGRLEEEAEVMDTNTEAVLAAMTERLDKHDEVLNSGARRMGALEMVPPGELIQRISGLSERLTAAVDRIRDLEDRFAPARAQHPYIP